MLFGCFTSPIFPKTISLLSSVNTEKNGVCILMEPNAMYNKAKSFYCEDYIVEMCAVTTNWSLHLCKLSYIKRYSPCLGQEFTITVNTQIKRKRNSVMR